MTIILSYYIAVMRAYRRGEGGVKKVLTRLDTIWGHKNFCQIFKSRSVQIH